MVNKGTFGTASLGFSESFIRYIGHPLWLTYKGERRILSHLRRLTLLRNVDRQALDNVRLAALKRLLAHAATTSYYYRDIFKHTDFEPQAVKSLDDIKALPLLTKEILNKQMDQLLSSAYRKDQLVKSSTGGSSGVPLTFYRDHRATMIRRAQDYFFNAEINIYPGVKRAWVWGSKIDAFSMTKLKARVMNFLTERAIYFYSFDTKPDIMENFLHQLNKHSPQAIFAYPNMLAALADYAKEKGIKVNPIASVIVTAEPVYDFHRKLFSEVFAAETFERYGSREIGTVASELPCHDGLHLFESCYYFEVLDSEGNNVPEGKMGELVVTDFYNYAMPLIRYRTGDMVRIDSSECDSGCTWRKLAAVGGRVVDLLIRPDGSKIAGEGIIMSLRTAGFRSQVQVVQTVPDAITLKYLASDNLPDDLKSRFQEKINDLFGAQIRIDYLPVEKLDYDKSGKYRYVTSECK